MTTGSADQRVVVWAAPKDARLTCEFLTGAGIRATARSSWRETKDDLDDGAGALIVAGEVLTPDLTGQLEEHLRRQPAWSDLPVIIVGGIHEGERLEPAERLGHVSVLRRPLSLDTLRSTVTAALRARGRQYQVRDLLRHRDEGDRRKDEFLAMLAHELRNPLAPLRTGLQLLHLKPPPDVVARTYAMMDRQIAHITRLVDDLLDVSRLTRGKITLQKQVIDLADCVRQTVESFKPLAAQKDVLLLVEGSTEPLFVDADPVRLEQMIGNVLNNALKFTPESGCIFVAAAPEGGQATLRVRDTGVGIPPDDLPYVFDLFAQTKRSLDRSQGGLGIGLTVVRLLVELHGGTATIHSEGEGTGTEVVMRLPISASLPQSVAATSGPMSLPAKQQRVLIIEDNHDAADMLATYLRLAGHEVHVAHDGPSGMRVAFEVQPTVILCDIGLPGMDGYRVAQALRSAPALSKSVMIALTGYGEVTARERTRSAGFTHHVIKPADPALIAELISRADEAA